MGSDTTDKIHKARALELANLGIGFSAAADNVGARDAWQKAFDYADEHLPGEDITYWIRDGLGAALLQVGDYQDALKMADSALEWCAQHQAPQASLTMAKSFLRLGDITSAQEYARRACDLRGKDVLRVFDAADLDVLGQFTHHPDLSSEDNHQ